MNRVITVSGLVVAVALGAAACRAQVSPEQREVATTFQRYSGFLRAMAGDSIAALYTPDGEMLDPDRVIRGRAAIRGFLAPFVGAVTVDSSAMTTDAIDIQGTQASVWGSFYQRYTPTGQPSGESRGRFSALLVRQSDGRWLIRHLLTATARQAP